MLKEIKANVRPTMSDRTSIGFRSIGAPAETKYEKLVPFVEVLDQPLVRIEKYLIDADPKHASRKLLPVPCAETRVVKHELLQPIIAMGRRERSQSPDVRVIVNRIPGAVEIDDQP